jgi:hypothetical protein
MKAYLDVFLPDAVIESGMSGSAIRVESDHVRLVIYADGTREERAEAFNRLAAVALNAAHDLMHPEVAS